MSDDWFRDYERRVRLYPRLTREEELLLAKRRTENSKDITRKLVEPHLRLAFSIAMKYRNTGVDTKDLVQYANLGLLDAVKTFDPSRGVRLATHAVWRINKAIRVGLKAERDRPSPSEVKQGEVNVRFTSRLITDTALKLAHRLCREPTREEIAEEIACTKHPNLDAETRKSVVKRFVQAIECSNLVMEPLEDEVEDTRADPDPIITWQQRNLFSDAFSRLSLQDQRIFVFFCKGRRYQDIAEAEGSTENTIRMRIHHSRKKLRAWLQELVD